LDRVPQPDGAPAVLTWPELMTLAAEEFIRRFLLHVLPKGFQRIRQYGFLGCRCRADKLARCRDLLGVPATITPAVVKDWRTQYEEWTGESLDRCPACQQGHMVRLSLFLPGQDWHVATAAIDSS
jgi:Putative transposase